jgi:phosphoribosylformylglycinamidine (FGAM) synthase PurS component
MEKINKTITPSGAEAEIANYNEQIIEEYRGNPLIEALPPILSKYEVMVKLAVYPYFNVKERELDQQYRVHLVQRLLNNYFQPLSTHIDLENRLSRVIRQGYLSRNPLRPEFARSMNQGYDMILNEDINMYNRNDSNSNTYGFSLIGTSGCGKTSSILRVLNTMPQIIKHSEYKGRKLNMYQLVYLKMDCPFDGSTRALCVNFFHNVDLKLGTNYHKKFSNSRISANALLPIMSQICKSHFLGCLIIDEIQHLSLAKSGGAQKMLAFFCTLINELEIPVVLIGTNKAMSIIQSDFRNARRGSGSQGDMTFDRMKKDENWNLFLEGMWEYQWTKKVVPLTEELNDIMYYHSQGIADVCKKIYTLSQIRAIGTGKEMITEKIINDVSKQSLKIMQPMLEALRTGNLSKLALYEDICAINIDGIINKHISNIELNSRIRELQSMRKKIQYESNTNIKEEAIVKLMELDVESNKAKKCVETAVASMEEDLTVNGVVKEAYRLTFENQTRTASKRTRTEKIEIMCEKDFRLIVDTGKKNGISAYESLKVSGYIKDIDNDLIKVG